VIKRNILCFVILLLTERYLDCASVNIAGSGTSTLDSLPDMFAGDLTVPGHIGPGECRSTAGYAIEYPNPGEAVTITEVQSIPFKKPTAGKCFAKVSNDKPTTPASSTASSSTRLSSSTFLLRRALVVVVLDVRPYFR
jgi:hypothetical protein